MSKEVVIAESDVERLRRGFEELGIKAALFDLDDTLFKTKFKEGAEMYKQVLEQEIGIEIDNDKFVDEWFSLWFELKKVHGVPVRLNRDVTEEMSARYGARAMTTRLEEAYESMMEFLYKTLPEEMPGASRTVAMLRKAGVKVYVVTHAEEEWTHFKLSTWKTKERWLEYGIEDGDEVVAGVFCVSVDKHKDIDAWIEALESFGLSPAEVMVAGDNVAADIVPMARLGVRHKFRMSASWGPSTKPLPAETVEVDDLYQMVESFLKGDK